MCEYLREIREKRIVFDIQHMKRRQTAQDIDKLQIRGRNLNGSLL